MVRQDVGWAEPTGKKKMFIGSPSFSSSALLMVVDPIFPRLSNRNFPSHLVITYKLLKCTRVFKFEW